MRFSIILWGLVQALRVAIRVYPKFAARVKEKDLVAQFKLQDNSIGRWIQFEGGRVKSAKGIHTNPDLSLFFQTEAIAVDFLTPPFDQLARIDAAKNFKVGMSGPDELVVWFGETLTYLQTVGWKSGTDMGNGVTRYCNGTNGGPVFVYVKDGKIIRITPIDFDGEDAPSWTIKARGKEFTPPRRTSLAAHGLALKSMVYSEDRILTPMKRVDFDPNGERNIQNRGKSEFEPISWDEALDIVVSEIKRSKAKGRGTIFANTGSHHQWGNFGHYLSAFGRLTNLLGCTKMMGSPDSWEGWFWGAMHHWGNSMRLGTPEFYGTVEDCLKEAEMIVFWSSDPDKAYGYEGTIRRFWAKELGIKMVHIDPHLNHTAALLGWQMGCAPKPGTDAALAQALCHVWITEDTYDKAFVENRTEGFDEWKGLHPRVFQTKRRKPRSGKRRKPVCPPGTCGHSPGSGLERKPILACRRLGLWFRRRGSRPNGRPVGPDDDDLRRHAGYTAGPASISATFSLVHPWISRSISPVTPRVACPASFNKVLTPRTTISACPTSSR